MMERREPAAAAAAAAATPWGRSKRRALAALVVVGLLVGVAGVNLVREDAALASSSSSSSTTTTTATTAPPEPYTAEEALRRGQEILELEMELAKQQEQDASDDDGGEFWSAANPPQEKRNNLPAFARLVQGKRFIVMQADTRVRPWKPSIKVPRNFSHDFARSSVLAMSHWARQNGYGYVFVDQGPGCADGPFVNDASPRVDQTGWSTFWCKISALQYVMRMLTHVPLGKGMRDRYVLVLDTDVTPGDLQLSLDSFVDVHLASSEPWSILVNTDKPFFWHFVLAAGKVYNTSGVTGGINAGVFLLRESNGRTRELLDELWFDLTQRVTPGEALFSSVTVKMRVPHRTTPSPTVAAVANHTSTSTSTSTVRRVFEWPPRDPSVLRAVAGVLNKAWGVSRVSFNAMWWLASDRIMVNVLPNIGDVERFREAAKNCCDHGRCFDAFVEAGAVPTPQVVRVGSESLVDVAVESCIATMWSALRTWPGEQDRLNLLADLHPDEVKVDPTRLLHEVVTPPFATRIVAHWCLSDNAKKLGAKRASMWTLDALGPEVGVCRGIWSSPSMTQQQPLSAHASCVGEWDVWGGRTALSRFVPAVRLPVAARGLNTKDVLANVVDAGDFDVRLGWMR